MSKAFVTEPAQRPAGSSYHGLLLPDHQSRAALVVFIIVQGEDLWMWSIGQNT